MARQTGVEHRREWSEERYAVYVDSLIEKHIGTSSRSIMTRFESRGWTYRMVYELFRSNPSWHRDHERFFALHDSLIAQGIVPDLTRRVLSSRTLYRGLDTSRLLVTIRAYEALGFCQKTLLEFSFKKPGIFLLTPEEIHEWHYAYQANGTTPLWYLRKRIGRDDHLDRNKTYPRRGMHC